MASAASAVAVFALAASFALCAPATAQKAQDTLRIAVSDWFSVLDPIWFPLDEAGQFTRTIYETLVSYDERTHKFVPRLAKSWVRTDPRTIEFELRDDVVFHNGNKFDADDVVYTFNYLIDPQVRMRFKERYNWMEKVEKLGPYKVRVVSHKAFATDLQMLAYRMYLYDSRSHRAMEKKEDYGRTLPVATGPYKVVSLDQNRGLAMERFDGYYDKSGNYPAPVKRVVAVPMPDRQSQIAQFMTGGIDVLRNVPADAARELARAPNARVTPTHAGMLLYLTLDALGRSDSKALTDPRVRKAFIMAIDRATLARTVIPGGEVAQPMAGICFPSNVGCSPGSEPVPYDPAGAKRLLTEAGLANGFDMVLTTYAPIREIGEAISGQLRAVGIRASIQPVPLNVWARTRAEGKMTAAIGIYPTSGQPDVSNMLDFFFTGDRDYWRDALIQEAKDKGAVEFDEKAREAIYRRALDRVNEMAYILPLPELPTVWVHSKDVRIVDNPLSPLETRLGDFAWR
jgi:peptide/nickel transport system substrate-binding protein